MEFTTMAEKKKTLWIIQIKCIIIIVYLTNGKNAGNYVPEKLRLAFTKFKR